MSFHCIFILYLYLSASFPLNLHLNSDVGLEEGEY